MDSKYQKLQKVQRGSLSLRRLKKYLALYGVGFFLWVGHLWQLLLVQLKYIDSTTNHWAWRWTVGLFQGEPPPKVYPIVYAIDTLGLIAFLIGMSYVVYWLYADCYCKSVETQTEVSFKKQLAIAIAFNVVIYAVLRFII